MTRAAIQVSGLSKSYGDQMAVKDVSFTVAPGSVVGLLGPNGAGKTTTLKALVGLVRPTAGTVHVHSMEDRPQSPAHVLGFALDPPGIDPGHQATRHLEIAATMAGIPRSRVQEVIEQYGIEDCARQRTRKLSTGQRQRLALATIQLGQPEILILDEPTNGLDAEGVRWLRRALRDHADSGGAVLISSHMLAEIQQIADEVVVLKRTVRYSGSLDALTHGGEQSLEDAYFDLLDEDASPRPARARPATSSPTPPSTEDRRKLSGTAV
jgi:ABC-2 type transport system ATP-binding protein